MGRRMVNFAPTVNIREYTAGDETRIIDLLKPHWTHLSHGNSLEYWRWEYRMGPRPAIITVAEFGDEIVGHYAVLPMRMKYGRKSIWGGKAEGGIVRKDFRGAHGLRHLPMGGTRTIYNLLITRTLKEAHSQGIQLIWGFPNQVALRGQVKAGYEVIRVPTSRFLIPITLRFTLGRMALQTGSTQQPFRTVSALGRGWFTQLVRRQTPGGPNCDARILDVTDHPAVLDPLWRWYDADTECITIARNREYLEWRMASNPVLHHQLLAAERSDEATAYVSFALVNHGSWLEGRIVDMIAAKGRTPDLSASLEQAVEAMRRGGAKLVTTWIAANELAAPCVESLGEAGFMRSSRRTMDVLVKTDGLEPYLARQPQMWNLDVAFTEGVG